MPYHDAMHTYMIRLFALLFVISGFSAPVFAADKIQPDGFGAAEWRMSREDIVAVEGLPDLMDDSNGTIWYLEKNVMGKRAEVIYNFEEGCSDLRASRCLMSGGYYIFKDGSKAYSDELEKMLTQKYGYPASVEKKIDASSHAGYVKKGKKVIEKTRYIRHIGKVKIVHVHAVKLHDYTDFAGEIHTAGSLHNTLHYYGPYHHGR
jgi:hypothetical protein